MKKINNASQFPKRYYGLHFSEGCASYSQEGKEPFMVFVGEKAMRDMDKTYEGKPVYVDHRDNVTPENVQDADGYVIRSFYNSTDGKHWCEFIVVSDKGHEAIRNGWRLSNAYEIKKSGAGGRWHGIDYHQEIIEGEYEHLAIVDDPRYAESIILTPNEFKEYNEQKENNLKSLSNSIKNKKKGKTMFNFFKKEKLENSDDLQTMSVMLPKSKKEVTIEKLINEADKEAMNEDKPDYAVKHALVKTNEGDLTVEELVNKYNEYCDKDKENEDEEDEDKKENKKKKKNEEKEDEEKKENEEEPVLPNEDDEDDKENEDDDEDDKKENKKKNSVNFNKLKNAEERTLDNSVGIDLSIDQVERGRKKYGSN